MNDFVVSFNLPTDEHLFIRHGTNTIARNAREAIAKVRPHIPGAFNFRAERGVVMLYGRRWCDWDSTRGAECAPASRKEKRHNGQQ